MIEMFKPELAMTIDSENYTPATVGDYVKSALRAKYGLVKVKEE